MTSPLRIVTVVGARPQFVKAAAVSRVIRTQFADRIEEKIIHTGQHFDENMSKVFFDDLDIPKPHYQLAISGGNHGAMTGKMLEAIETVLLQEKPDWLLVYGDTNSTLAGALAAAKLHIPVAHVEAGLRSFNMRMPEEINRALCDRVSSLLFCPTQTAIENLAKECVINGVHNVGDVMYDVALFYKDRASAESSILKSLQIELKGYALATCHRAENTDDASRLKEILTALSELANKMPVVFPLHPRTRKLIQTFEFGNLISKLIVIEPVSFLDMVALEQAASIILTDSGGVQKEAFFYRVPCITMRDETEWVETVHSGMNQTVGASRDRIIAAVDLIASLLPNTLDIEPFGDGFAATKIAMILKDA